MPSKAPKTKTWKDLKPSTKVQKANFSPYTKLKNFLVYLKYSFILALLVCIGIGSYLLYKSESIESVIYSNSQRIKNFLFEQDKNITGRWLWNFIEIKPSTPLDAIDIFEIKARIESLKQIDSVKIEKIYPDSLKISIKEKDYIAKTYHNAKLLVMSSKGDYYEPICLSQEILAKLPELVELKIEIKDDNYLPFDKALKLQELINLTKATQPSIYETWHEINMKKANYLVEPLMEIHTLDNVKIVFSFDNFKEQLLKLKSALEFSRKNSVHFAEIDLSILRDRADAKIRTP